jgi:hypothetical protein
LIDYRKTAAFQQKTNRSGGNSLHQGRNNTAYRFDRRCCSLAEKSSFSFFISAAAIFNFVGTMGDTCTVVLR